MSTPHLQANYHTVVLAADGLFGTVDTHLLVDDQTSVGDEMLIVRRDDGESMGVFRSSIDRITDDTIYLSVRCDSLPRMQQPDPPKYTRNASTENHVEMTLAKQTDC